MLDEKTLQERVNRRLSGLRGDELRRMRIRAVVQQERSAISPMKKKLSPVLVCLLILLFVTASVALAEHLNLFHLFGQQDERYAQVADEAAVITAQPVEGYEAPLEQGIAQIDNAYYDGLTLNLALSIAQGTQYEAYTPTAQELAAMEEMSPMPVAIPDAQAPGADILAAYNQALQSGTPYGYRACTIYPSDHTRTDDGIDIPQAAGDSAYGEDGAYYEMREFALPLPAELTGRDTLHLEIGLYQSVQTVYFDGTKCYTATQRSDAGTLTATVPRSSAATLKMAGTAQISGVTCSAEAEVSPMAAVISLRCEVPLETLLSLPDGLADTQDAWLEIIATDEQGRLYRPDGTYPTGQTQVNLSLLGVGELPQTLTVYVYYAQEGESLAVPNTQKGITLYPVD